MAVGKGAKTAAKWLHVRCVLFPVMDRDLYRRRCHIHAQAKPRCCWARRTSPLRTGQRRPPRVAGQILAERRVVVIPRTCLLMIRLSDFIICMRSSVMTGLSAEEAADNSTSCYAYHGSIGPKKRATGCAQLPNRPRGSEPGLPRGGLTCSRATSLPFRG